MHLRILGFSTDKKEYEADVISFAIWNQNSRFLRKVLNPRNPILWKIENILKLILVLQVS